MVKIEKLPGKKDISEAIKANAGYCICAVEKNQDTRCLCKEFREQKESGICHCGLYKKTVTKD
jgi:hypothetical protein